MDVDLFSAFSHGIKFRIFVARVQSWAPQTYLYEAQKCIQYTSCSVKLNIGQRDDSRDFSNYGPVFSCYFCFFDKVYKVIKCQTSVETTPAREENGGFFSWKHSYKQFFFLRVCAHVHACVTAHVRVCFPGQDAQVWFLAHISLQICAVIISQTGYRKVFGLKNKTDYKWKPPESTLNPDGSH